MPQPEPRRKWWSPVASRSFVMAVAMLLPMVGGLSGCASLQSMIRRPPAAPVVFEEVPASDQLLQTIRANSAAVQQLECDVKVTMEGVPAGATGKLRCWPPTCAYPRTGSSS